MNDVDAINVVSDDEECDAVLLIQKHLRKFYWVLCKKECMHYMEIVRRRYLAMIRIAIRLQPRWLQRKQCLSLTEN